MLIRWPAGAGGAARPLVLLLHGSGQTGVALLQLSAMAAAADRHGFIVAAPNGAVPVQSGFAWHIPGVPTVTGRVPPPTTPDDVRYLVGATEFLVSQGCVDPTRVYVTGLSGGARMASWLACVAPERFAAIAPVVGLRAGHPKAGDPGTPDPATCRPSMPMPILTFAGDRDLVNPIRGGGAGYWQYSMHAAEQRWAQLNGCVDPPTTRWIRPGLYEERYSGCRADAEIVAHVTVGGGHDWRVADNEAMWTFFARHRR